MSGSQLVVQAIRDLLRARGMTYRELAERLGVSVPTVKRDLSRGDFSLSRLDQICEALEITIGDLLQNEVRQSEEYLTQLSSTQEDALVTDPKLLLLTYLLINHWSFDEIISTYSIDENELISLLLRLDQLKIIDYRPPRRVRKLTARNFTWRKDGPVQEFFLKRIVPEFFDIHSEERDADSFYFVAGMLSESSRQYLANSMQQLAREFDELSRRDNRLSLGSRHGCSAVLALRHWEFSDFTHLRRKPRTPA
ncbi:MAG: helix-turn-helix transcriptional regulator [Xanthomonadaceae bacterium]|jgi:transcriptional regulator with XRE-family HTH domain|nr:helix-turn-helix transcriptional regulator [Xanthomonadaceae bacterium]